jgi:glycosyltransferase involved in cell wall biosynthesis
MKIGYVIKMFPRLSETFILTELLELERLGAEVTVFSRHHPVETLTHSALGGLRAEVVQFASLLGERLWETFELQRRLARRFPEAHDAAFDAALAFRSRDEMRAWLLAGAVAEDALHRELDLLHAHFATLSASVAYYASRITGIPFTFTAHARDIYAHEVDRGRLKILLEAAAAVVTVSDENRRFLESIAPTSRVVRIYNGVDLSRFPALPAPPAPDPPLILFVGRAVEKKGVPDLLAALALLRRRGSAARCRIVGGGPLEASLRQQVADLGLVEAADFVEAASQEDVIGIHLPAASASVVPCIVASDGDRDGLPTTLLEAMARGVPVVSTRLPGIPEAVPDGTAGLLCDPGDVEGLAAAIQATLDDRAGTVRRTRAARDHVERTFDTARNVKDLLALFREVSGARIGGGVRS